VTFFVEHVIVYNVKRGTPRTRLDVPLEGIALNAVVETVVWVVWLLLWDLYPFALFGVGVPAFAILWLNVTLVLEHALTDNIFHGRPLGQHLWNPKVLGFSLVEANGANVALGLVALGPLGALLGLAVFAGSSYVEHRMALALART